MPDIALHELPDAGALTGTEIVPIDNGTATVKTTVGALRAGLAAASHTHTAAGIADGTATGRSLVTAADAATARGVLGLGTIATQNLTVSADGAQGLALRNQNGGSAAACRVTLGNNADDVDAYVQVNGSANTSHGGTRSLNILANAGDICFLVGRLSPSLRFRVTNGGAITVGHTTVFDAGAHLTLRSYTVSTLPSASPAGRVVYVSDGASNKRLAVSTGADWRWPDGTVVS